MKTNPKSFKRKSIKETIRTVSFSSKRRVEWINFSSAEVTILKNKICWGIISPANTKSNPEGRNCFCHSLSTPSRRGLKMPIAVCYQCTQILTINGYKRESLHAYIYKLVRLKCTSPPDTRALSPGCCVHFSNVSNSSVWMSLWRLSSLHWTYALSRDIKWSIYGWHR